MEATIEIKLPLMVSFMQRGPVAEGKYGVGWIQRGGGGQGNNFQEQINYVYVLIL